MLIRALIGAAAGAGFARRAGPATTRTNRPACRDLSAGSSADVVRMLAPR